MATVVLVESKTGKKRAKLDVPIDASCIQFSPNGESLAVGSKALNVGIYHVATGRIAWKIAGQVDEPLRAIAYSPDGRTIALAYSFSLHLIELGSGKRRAQFEGSNELRYVAFLPDGRSLIAGGYDTKVDVWDVYNSNKRLHIDEQTRYGRSTALSKDGKTIAIAMWPNCNLRFWDTAKGIRKLFFQGHDTPISSVALRQTANEWPPQAQISIRSYGMP